MMIKLLKKARYFQKKDVLAATILLFTFVSYYSIIIIHRIPTDLQPHAKTAYLFAHNQVKLPPNFLYFFFIALFSGFSKQYTLYYIPSVLLISSAIAGKFLLTKYYSDKFCLSDNHALSPNFIIAMGMLFVFALPGLNYFSVNEFYLGQLAPNVWHSSTTICLMPFSIILFFESYDVLFFDVNNSGKKKWKILALLLLNALIKPSFLFTLLPSVFLFFFGKLLSHPKEINKFHKLYPYVAAVFFISIEYFFIYKLNYAGDFRGVETKSGITISPFTIWRIFSPNCLVAFFTSCFFPLVYIAVTKGKVFKNRLIQFAAVNYVIGLLVWILLAEEGIRKSDGNFIWQMVVVSYLLFFTMLIEFANAVKLRAITKLQQWVIGGAFFLHFAWGVFYWLKIIIFKGYS
jgi:hypothetical protein